MDWFFSAQISQLDSLNCYLFFVPYVVKISSIVKHERHVISALCGFLMSFINPYHLRYGEVCVARLLYLRGRDKVYLLSRLHNFVKFGQTSYNLKPATMLVSGHSR